MTAASGKRFNIICEGGCGRVVKATKTGLCRPCWSATQPVSPRRFREPCRNACGRDVQKGLSGLCRACRIEEFNSDPEIAAKRAAGLRQRTRDPAEKDIRSARAKRAARTRMGIPGYADRLVEVMKRVQPLSLTPENFAKRDYKHIGQLISKAKLKWLPDEYRRRYYYLTKSRNMHAADARAIIEDEMALKHVRSALEHLRHFAPVQVLENGFRYGNAILRPAEVVKRAELRGWKPEDIAA